MAGKIYVGNGSNKAKKPSKIYVGGSDDKAHLVKAIYVGDSSNKARKVWPMSDINDSRFEQLGWVTSYDGNIYPNPSPSVYPRIVIEFSVPTSTDLNYSEYHWGGGPFIRHNILAGITTDGSVYEENVQVYYIFDMSVGGVTTYYDTRGYDGSTYVPEEYHMYLNGQEGVLRDTTYIVDFTAGGPLKLYNSIGFYSISSNNNLGTYKKYTFPSGYTVDPDTSIFMVSRDNIKVYNILIYNESSVLTHKFVPCYRISDNKLGFFDTVNRIFYPNDSKTTADTNYYGLM